MSMFEIKTVEEKMNKIIDFHLKKINDIDSTKPRPSMVDEIEVECYNSKMHIKQLAAISVSSHSSLTLSPFDRSTEKAIAKAVQEQLENISCSSSNGNIIINLPPLTEERRKGMIKVVKEYLEHSKISIRNVRRDAIKDIEKIEDLSKDLKEKYEQQIQKLTDLHIKQIEDASKEKEKEILKI